MSVMSEVQIVSQVKKRSELDESCQVGNQRIPVQQCNPHPLL